MKLIILRDKDREEFKMLMQQAFQYGYESTCGKEDSLVLSEEDIDNSINNLKCHSYEMIDENDNIVGGAVVEINENNINHLDFLFVTVGVQSKGIGQKIWKELEALYPNTKIWKTCTPYFDKRNIHFYVNKLKFKIVEYYNEKHPDLGRPEDNGMFELEKEM